MCLIIHKPAGVEIPHELLSAASVHNPDGWGAMGFDVSGRIVVERQAHVDLIEIADFVHAHRDSEIALHLRRQTRGGSGAENTHPFRIADGLWLMHNGTLKIGARVANRSDTWHFVSDILRPLSQRHPGLLSDRSFLKIIEMAVRPENKMALLDAKTRRIALLNQEHGAELDGLWLSSTRWIDRERFPLTLAPQPQERSYSPTALHFA